MSYIIYRQKPTAKQTFVSFKCASNASNYARQEPDKKHQILRQAYEKVVELSANDEEQKNIITILPPATGVWEWGESLEMALSFVGDKTEEKFVIIVPEVADIDIAKPGANVPMTPNTSNVDDMILHDMGEAIPEDDAFREDNKMIHDLVNNCAPGFSVYLNKIMDTKHMTDEELATKSNLTTETIRALRDGSIVVPSKSNVLAIGVALKLGEAEFDVLMKSGGYLFSDAVPRDKIVKFYISQGASDIHRINKTLFLMGIPVLGNHTNK